MLMKDDGEQKWRLYKALILQEIWRLHGVGVVWLGSRLAAQRNRHVLLLGSWFHPR
jgi:hypothetical protein